MRWNHPELGLLAPGAFIQTVEQTGLIGPLTRHVLDRAIAQCAEWRSDGRDLSVAVNLSVRNLLDRELPKEIERMLSDYSLPPEALRMMEGASTDSLFSGLERLGLKLENRKAPLETVVVDHILKTPTEN